MRCIIDRANVACCGTRKPSSAEGGSPVPAGPHRPRPRASHRSTTAPRRRPRVQPVPQAGPSAVIAPRARRAQVAQGMRAAQGDRHDVIDGAGVAATPPAGPPVPGEHLLPGPPPAPRGLPRTHPPIVAPRIVSWPSSTANHAALNAPPLKNVKPAGESPSGRARRPDHAWPARVCIQLKLVPSRSVTSKFCPAKKREQAGVARGHRRRDGDSMCPPSADVRPAVRPLICEHSERDHGN